MTLTATIAAISSGASIVINTKKIYDDLVSPMVRGLNSGPKRESLISARIDDFLKKSSKRYRQIDTIVYPGKKIDLLQIYTPLTLTREGDSGEESYLIDNFDLKVFRRSSLKLVVDNAGMGKSTLFKYLYLTCIKESTKIPILIELRRIKNLTIEEFIAAELSNKSCKLSLQEIDTMIKQGALALFFDGLDEVNDEDVPAILENIRKIGGESEHNSIFLSSRDSDFLTGLAEFERFSIKPLSVKEAKTLIIRYGLQKVDFIERLLQEVDQRYTEISEFLKNPLMVSLLYKSFEHKNYVPLKKNIFYRQVYDALFESHDLSKGGGFRRHKNSKLDLDEFYKVCRVLGFISYRRGDLEFTRDELIELITECKTLIPEIPFKPSELLEDLVKAVPLFVKDGGIYRWMHKSFQEYFAAQSLHTDFRPKVGQVLDSIYNSSDVKHRNFLDLYFDIDTYGYTKHILSPALEEYKRLAATSKPVLKKYGLYSSGNENVLCGRRFALILRDKDVSKDLNYFFGNLDDIILAPVEPLGGSILFITEYYKKDFFWEIPAKRFLGFVSLMSPGADSMASMEGIMSILLQQGNLGIGNNKDVYYLNRQELTEFSSFIRNHFYLKIDFSKAQDFVDSILNSRKVSDDLFNF